MATTYHKYKITNGKVPKLGGEGREVILTPREAKQIIGSLEPLTDTPAGKEHAKVFKGWVDNATASTPLPPADRYKKPKSDNGEKEKKKGK